MVKEQKFGEPAAQLGRCIFSLLLLGAAGGRSLGFEEVFELSLAARPINTKTAHEHALQIGFHESSVILLARNCHLS